MKKKPIIYIILLFYLLINLVFLLHFSKKIGIDPFGPPNKYFGDGHENYAIGLLEGKLFEPDFWPKSVTYSLFMAGIFKLFGQNFFAVRLIQIFIALLSVFILYNIGRHLFSENVGLFAAALFAIYPTFIMFNSRIMTETLYIFLVILSLYTIIYAAMSAKYVSFVLAGIVLGLTTMTRPATIFFLPFVFLYFLIFYMKKLGFRKFILSQFLLFVPVVFMILLWTYRNYKISGFCIPFSPRGGYVLYEGNNPYNKSGGGRRGIDFIEIPEIERLPLIEKNKIYGKMAKKWIKQNRLKYIKLCFKRLYRLYKPTPYASVYKNVYALITGYVFYLSILLIGLVGFYLMYRDGHYDSLFLLLAFVLINTLFYSLIVVSMRYRLPVIPLFILAAAYALNKIKAISQK